MEHRNAQYNSQGDIDLEINHPEFGWTPFTACPNDTEAHGRALFEQAKNAATPYSDPGPQPGPVPHIVSRFQARAALHVAGMLAAAEAAIQGADDISKLAWADAQEFRRSSPLVVAVAAQLNLTSEDLDDLFRQAATIEA